MTVREEHRSGELLAAYRERRGKEQLALPGWEAPSARKRRGTVETLLSHVSHEVSRASHQVGFAIAPDMTMLERLDFVPLDGGKLLVVVVAAGGHVTHKVIEPSEEYEPGELQQAANYLNHEFKGRSLIEVRQAVLERLSEERTLYDELMARALRLASTTFEGIDPVPTVFIQGTSLLLEDVGSEDAEVTLTTLRTLLRMIEEKTRLVQLLDDYMGTDGLTVVIGSEHHAPDLQHFSLVASTYFDGHGTGAVGVIGPTRMRYSRAINAVDTLSRAISRMVNGKDM